MSCKISTETVIELVDVLLIDAFIIVEGAAVERELIQNNLQHFLIVLALLLLAWRIIVLFGLALLLHVLLLLSLLLLRRLLLRFTLLLRPVQWLAFLDLYPASQTEDACSISKNRS